MCLKPVHVRVKLSSVTDGSPLFVDAPCGHCYQCLQRKQNDYYVRTYYESLFTFNKGGFVLMDTLTYDDAHLPHVSRYFPFAIPSDLDFPCFDSDNFRLFIAALRSRLKRDGFSVANVRYFLCSEYGTSEGKTHRPHYHIMFFVTNSAIKPVYLSNLIAEYWKYGRTDGVPYRGSFYVLHHCTFGYGYNDNFSSCLASCCYVSKYVTKDSDFLSVVSKRFSLLEAFVLKTVPDFDLKSVKSMMRQFLRLSKGFGAQILYFVDIDKIISDDGIWLPDRNSVKRKYPLSTYYRRKLFFDVVHYVDDLGKNHVFYQSNNKGIEYLNSKIDSSVDYLTERFKNIYLSVKNKNDSFLNHSLKQMDDIISVFPSSDVFYNRLSLYSLFIKGRVFFGNYDSILSLDREYICALNNVRYDLDYHDLVKHAKDADYIGDIKCLSDGHKKGFEPNVLIYTAESRVYPDLFSNSNLSNYVFTKDLRTFTCEEFTLFDTFLKCFELISYYFNLESDDSFRLKVSLQRKLKKFK